MQTANILLALGGDSGNQVPKYGVTAAEIAVLRAIHGEDSVFEILPIKGGVERSNRTELSRLRATYGGAFDNEGRSIVETLFPGAAARVFETLDELELDNSLFAAKGRATAADAENDGYDTMKVADLKAVAASRGIDLGTASKKPDIIALLEAADEAAGDTEDDDEVEDLDKDDAKDDAKDGSSIFE